MIKNVALDVSLTLVFEASSIYIDVILDSVILDGMLQLNDWLEAVTLSAPVISVHGEAPVREYFTLTLLRADVFQVISYVLPAFQLSPPLGAVNSSLLTVKGLGDVDETLFSSLASVTFIFAWLVVVVDEFIGHVQFRSDAGALDFILVHVPPVPLEGEYRH